MLEGCFVELYFRNGNSLDEVCIWELYFVTDNNYLVVLFLGENVMI